MSRQRLAGTLARSYSGMLSTKCSTKVVVSDNQSSQRSSERTSFASHSRRPRRLIQLQNASSTTTNTSPYFLALHSHHTDNFNSTVEKGSTYAKTTGMIKYVKKWIAAGVPIDGIGAQAHLMAGEAKNVPASLTALCAAAPQCALTEVDIVNAAPGDYVTTIKACVDIPNCVGVTVWGVRDPDSWRASNNPLLFDSAYATKPAYAALVSTLGALPTATAKPTL